ncbi:hypothetical protein [Caballeronia fortuita]|uniref:hypothetical protein n=1 Tax=Caballeronia fortuita TaxID=1777138 RepID=UPI001FC92ED6|nr:hypothetical protein [Caballeronia fortuita]
MAAQHRTRKISAPFHRRAPSLAFSVLQMKSVTPSNVRMNDRGSQGNSISRVPRVRVTGTIPAARTMKFFVTSQSPDPEAGAMITREVRR